MNKKRKRFYLCLIILICSLGLGSAFLRTELIINGTATIHDARWNIYFDNLVLNPNNENSSVIKTAIDNWYSTNMVSFTNKLEDAVYCNDRSIYTLGGWDPDGGNASEFMIFETYHRIGVAYTPSFECANISDSFTVSSANGNGKLTYPVGLLTSDEAMFAGGKSATNNKYYLYTGQTYWLGSPRYMYFNDAYGFFILGTGYINLSSVGTARGVRPVITLKPGLMSTDGDGTSTNPYIVE